jgi:3-carboxy-cis,cis-muconate cycloisomerase
MAEAVSMALAEKVGKSNAHHLIESASKKAVAERRHLRDVLASDGNVTTHFDVTALERLFDPMGYQGASQVLIDRLLASLDDP